MQSVGAFADGEWDFSRMFSIEELEMAPELLGQCLFPVENDKARSYFATPTGFSSNPEANVISMTEVNESLFYSWNSLNPNLHFTTQENSNSGNFNSSVFIPSSSPETFFLTDSNHIPAMIDNSMSMNICKMDEQNAGSFVSQFPEISMVENACVTEDMSCYKIGNLDGSLRPLAYAVPAKELLPKRKFDAPQSQVEQKQNMKKKPRAKRDAPKWKKNVQSKKNQKFNPNSNGEEEEINAGHNGHSFSSYSSGDEHASQDAHGEATSGSKMPEALNSNDKTRATRGSATDPHSLYARKRRERINERLRILQNLVPNGTKVDISTMLEEAVHYVKFLQLQIKLLSSDDLWIYAPIAYNGIDIGLNKKISMLL